MQPIKTAFIFDDGYMVSEQGDEVQSAIGQLGYAFDLETEQIEPCIDISFSNTHITDEFLSRKFDLVIIDYGGVSVLGGSGLAEFEIRTVCEYAENHPGCLVVIWTQYTADIYEYELKEKFGHLDNIVCRYKMLSFSKDNEWGTPEFIEKFGKWFSGHIEYAKSIEIDTSKYKLNEPDSPGI